MTTPSTADHHPGALRAHCAAPRARGVRAVDLCVGLVAFLFALPLLAAAAVAVWALDGRPILFAHRRVGLGGREFACLKFRTMATGAEGRLQAVLSANPGARAEWELYHKLDVDPRVTRLGRFLRTSSLDELPQILNVIRGEMSLVGPRPIVSSEIGRYGRYFGAYCAVRPGITGLWQVIGRNRVSYRRRVAMDVFYVRRRSLLLNLWILAGTVPAVLMRRGAS